MHIMCCDRNHPFYFSLLYPFSFFNNPNGFHYSNFIHAYKIHRSYSHIPSLFALFILLVIPPQQPFFYIHVIFNSILGLGGNIGNWTQGLTHASQTLEPGPQPQNRESFESRKSLIKGNEDELVVNFNRKLLRKVSTSSMIRWKPS
jgi:hypothetical protein